MAQIPCPGAISFSAIKTEISTSVNSLSGLIAASTLADKTGSHSLSQFQCYSHSVSGAAIYLYSQTIVSDRKYGFSLEFILPSPAVGIVSIFYDVPQTNLDVWNYEAKIFPGQSSVIYSHEVTRFNADWSEEIHITSVTGDNFQIGTPNMVGFIVPLSETRGNLYFEAGYDEGFNDRVENYSYTDTDRDGTYVGQDLQDYKDGYAQGYSDASE